MVLGGGFVALDLNFFLLFSCFLFFGRSDTTDFSDRPFYSQPSGNDALLSRDGICVGRSSLAVHFLDFFQWCFVVC